MPAIKGSRPASVVAAEVLIGGAFSSFPSFTVERFVYLAKFHFAQAKVAVVPRVSLITNSLSEVE